ncbi:MULTISPECIES: patatin-like phospholipase family protein [unclassified Lysobacter]|uniref:patatin-like phospholipase family protein n=1 Tax=unclassified Lysobacter TaxID=2635362 RepID=UPI001C227F28|nr:patatin-like phospholipase family protein [Lysobacter sp. MMG2]MBU8977628.1 patatin-like phospholipase family protein [Lysobacter sp. MMG2]
MDATARSPLLRRLGRALSGAALVAAGLTALPAAAQSPPARNEPACVGLVLGGGGARGSAHIGVLKVLERERIPVCKMAGTSMGSIVGGLYATGYTPAEMENLIETIDWADMFVDDPPRPGQPMRRKDADFRYLLDLEIGYVDGRVVLPVGIVQGQKLLMLMRRLTISTWNVHDFDNLPIPFRAVAADIVTGDKVVFQDGDLALAIRSSMSVPGAFAPVRVGDRLLVDGGMVDNVPVDVVREMGAHRLIVVDVGSPLHKEEALTNPIVIMDQMISALMSNKTERTLATLGPGDVLIRPELGDITAAEFNRGAEAIAIGERAAEAALPRLRALSVDEATYAAYRERQRKRDFDPKLVSFLDVVEGRSPSATRQVERAVADNLDKPFDAERLEKDIGTAYGDGRFQQIDYRLVERDGERGLQIIPAEKPWSAFGKLGFQLDDNFNGRNSYMVSAELTFNDVNTLGAEWRNVMRLGRITGLRSEFYQPFGETGAFYLQPSLELRNESLPLWRDGNQLAEFRINRRQLALQAGFTPQPEWRISAELLRGRDRGDLLIGNPADFSGAQEEYAGIMYNATWDTLDSINFPTRGVRVSADLETYYETMGANVEGNVARLTGDWAQAWGRYHLLLGARLTSALEDDNFFQAQGFLGGFLNLSGFDERALAGNQTALARAVMYRRTGNTSRLFSLPMYVGASLETGNAWTSKDAVDADDLILAGSLFVGFSTPLGPMFLAYGGNDEGESSWYLTFGSLLRPEVK